MNVEALETINTEPCTATATRMCACGQLSNTREAVIYMYRTHSPTLPLYLPFDPVAFRLLFGVFTGAGGGGSTAVSHSSESGGGRSNPELKLNDGFDLEDAPRP